MKIALTNAKIIPIIGEVLEKGSLIINSSTGKIEKIISSSIQTSNDITTIDCSGKTITPGLIDAHSHVGLFEEASGPGPGNQDGNEMTSPITPYLRAIDAIFPEDMGFEDARKGGVTTLGCTPGSGNLIGGQFAVIKTAGKMLDDMLVKEPAGLKMAFGENPKRVGSNNKRPPNTRMSNAHLIREAFYKALDYKHEWETYEKQIEKNFDDEKPPKRPKKDLGNEILLELLNKKFPARMHAHRADDIRTAIRIADEFGFMPVIDHCTEGHKIAKFLAERGIPVIVGPLMTSRTKRELKDRTPKTPGVLVDSGVKVCITTDAPVIPIYMLRESVIIAIREGLDSTKALETITINPASILGIDHRVGSLTVGKDADIVIWNGDPLDARTSVFKTFINGKEVYS
jgi:imidazolonepropionase-like amidohydrolase